MRPRGALTLPSAVYSNYFVFRSPAAHDHADRHFTRVLVENENRNGLAILTHRALAGMGPDISWWREVAAHAQLLSSDDLICVCTGRFYIGDALLSLFFKF